MIEKEKTALRRRISYVNVENMVIRNCFYAIQITNGSRVNAFVAKNATVERNDHAIYADSYINSNLFLNECFLRENGIAISGNGNGTKVLEVRHCSITGGRYGIYEFENTRLYLYNSHMNAINRGIRCRYATIVNCTMTDHSDVAIYIAGQSSTSILETLFERNKRVAYVNSQNSACTFNIRNCRIVSTKGDSLAFVLSRTSTASRFLIRNNSFMQNAETIIKIANPLNSNQKHVMNIESNTFFNNTALTAGSGIMEFTGDRLVVRIASNKFLKNKCTFIGKFNVWRSPGDADFEFINNTVVENDGFPYILRDSQFTNVTSFSVGVFGCYSHNYTFHRNIFNNQRMDVEFFVGSGCGTNYYHNGPQIDAKYNWWGTSSVSDIRERIFDFDDWNNRAKVSFLPSAKSSNFSSFSSSLVFANSSYIGGHFNSSVELTAKNSPYMVTSDLTVAWNASLIINPGVKLYFYPRVGLLILGNIFALGSTDKPIRFCSFTKRCVADSPAKDRDSIRLSEGSSMYNGRIEVLVGSTWKVICYRYFSAQEARVACRQLGYGKLQSVSDRYYGSSNGPVEEVSVNCAGNESSLSDCEVSSVGYCNPLFGKYLVCQDGGKWGNVRISSYNKGFATSLANEERSILQNIHIDHSGVLHHDETASSIQIINRSPSVKHVVITNGNGIEIISPQTLMELENVTVEGNHWTSAIIILGNKGSVMIRRANVLKSRSEGITIGSIENLNFFQTYLGLADLCDPYQKIFVTGAIYIYLRESEDFQEEVICTKELISPGNTSVVFRLLSWPEGSFSLDVHDGSMITSPVISSLRSGNYREFQSRELASSSNSAYLRVSSRQLKEGFLAEVTFVDKTGNPMLVPLFTSCVVD